MRLVFPLITAVALGACVSTASDTADQLARTTAKSVVNGIVADKFPGVDASPITDCIIDAASAAEIFEIAKAGATGVTADTVETVTTIAARPDTVSCISQNGLGLFL
ncbi:succinate dehydrogenase [Planktotalea sp.]|uniref:succinate dehydrogenase n=1 Tax=Planktotalea sp. TaxID=2029877 RepID=UPI003297DF64